MSHFAIPLLKLPIPPSPPPSPSLPRRRHHHYETPLIPRNPATHHFATRVDARTGPADDSGSVVTSRVAAGTKAGAKHGNHADVGGRGAPRRLDSGGTLSEDESSEVVPSNLGPNSKSSPKPISKAHAKVHAEKAVNLAVYCNKTDERHAKRIVELASITKDDVVCDLVSDTDGRISHHIHT